ncbi:MAG: RluA family pseudouridine synthase [Candidatus Eisenbacteria bacterium]|uniref:RluA family pseudouridine synthase n=1 Tax=Eiseniibacteriota bacterium TaxID=2212470 RepID=A0A937XA03_UNCEI|nr:RluA family pseudouridine synthase [Candidatus Eisenbacteria bacterium]
MHIVGEAEHRLRLDRFLYLARPDLSRRAIERLLRSGAVRVDGAARDARHFVKRGERVEIAAGWGDEAVAGPAPIARAGPGASPPCPAAPAGDGSGGPRILLASAGVLVIAKPPGLTTNPALRGEPSLLAWLREQAPEITPAGGFGAHPPGLLHRLDRDASGLVFFSRTPAAHRALLAAFRVHDVERVYLALVCGRAPGEGVCDLPLARTPRGRMLPRADGLPALTRFERLRAGPRASLLRVSPRTGRMHQIRAHLAALGHPVAGDPLYGDPRGGDPLHGDPRGGDPLHRDPRGGLGAPRLWLHAERLALPIELAARLGLPPFIDCPLWPDLAAHLAALGWSVPRPAASPPGTPRPDGEAPPGGERAPNALPPPSAED